MTTQELANQVGIKPEYLNSINCYKVLHKSGKTYAFVAKRIDNDKWIDTTKVVNLTIQYEELTKQLKRLRRHS